MIVLRQLSFYKPIAQLLMDERSAIAMQKVSKERCKDLICGVKIRGQVNFYVLFHTSFVYSGHFKEKKSVILFLFGRKRNVKIYDLSTEFQNSFPHLLTPKTESGADGWKDFRRRRKISLYRKKAKKQATRLSVFRENRKRQSAFTRLL